MQALQPVHRLPLNVLSEIFKEVMRPLRLFYDEWGSSSATYPPVHLVSSRLPLRLAAVCAAWRRAALEAPGLWQLLVLNMDVTSQRRDRLAAGIRLCLERSQAAPLTVVVTSATQEWKVNWLDVVRKISEQCSRLENLRVCADNGAIIQAMLAFFSKPLPKLKNLMLKSKAISYELALMLDIPQVCGLSLIGLDVTFALAHVGQMRNVTILNLFRSSIPPQSVWNILSACPSLQQLSLSFPNDVNTATAGPTRDLQLCLLTKLTLDGLAACKVVAVFGGNRLDFPSLQNIHFFNAGGHSDQWRMVIDAFATTIKCISFSNCDLTGVSGCYLDAPSALQSIVIKECHVKAQFFADLRRCELPSLRQLKILEGTRFSQTCAPELVSFVEDRLYRPINPDLGRVARLDSVVLVKNDLIDKSYMARIRRALTAGADARAQGAGGPVSSDHAGLKSRDCH